MTEHPMVIQPQTVKVGFKDVVDADGIPCVEIILEVPETAALLAEPTPAMYAGIYIVRQFKDGNLMPLIEEFVRSGQFVKTNDHNSTD